MDYSDPSRPRGQSRRMPRILPTARAKQAINKDDSRGYRIQRAKEIGKEGETRTKMLMSNPPIKVVERYTNGKWVEVSRQRQAQSGAKKKLLPKKTTDVGTAIKRMQRNQPWN